MTRCALPSPGPAGTGASMRRGACPSLASPMQTGDGLLVRLRPATDGLTPMEIEALAAAAAACGNGIIEITARGNLQIRGLTASTVQALAAAIGEAGIAIAEGVAIETPPLAGIDPDEIADPRPLARALSAQIACAQPTLRLAPKLSIVIDGGGRFHLGDVAADLRLSALDGPDGARWLLSVGGTARSARPIALLEAEECVSAVMEILAELCALAPAARGRDLDADRLRLRWYPGAALPAATESVPPLPAGIHHFGAAGVVLGLGLAFAQAEAAGLAAFVRQAQELGAREMRLAPRHGLFVLGLSGETAALAQRLAASYGFLVAADDRRNPIATCAGLACASALMDTKATARLLVEAAPDLLDGSLAMHLSGCGKGCARPAASPLTLVGAPSGYALVVNGTASVAPSAYRDDNGIRSALAALGALVRENKDAGESALSCLTRLGTARIAQAFEQE
ncbi:precorrin-3B synthase [Sinorhizobium saheli]|uniref:Precorrin-3B synthase n=1 Tax=Sinorhizobium saheli TaxID=36856 RepID=A0A178XKN3_SINSA|nr:precorrin-3B synthase [Sinorhizobium saheli]OAP35799.1 precorrin-3B synthase [Sinorhizobium saheli]